MKKRDLHGKNLIEKKHDPENYTQTRMYIPRHVTLTSKCNIKVVKGTSPKPQLKFPSHGQSSNAQYKSKTVLLLLNSKAISRKCFFILTQVSKMCTRCWWKLCQIQFGNLHHHFTYQCTVSQSNSFSTHTVHTLKKLFYTPIWQGEKLLRRAHVQFSHTKEKAPHDCIHAHTCHSSRYTTFTLSSKTCCKLCTYKPSGFTVAAVCDVHLRPYQPCYVYICMHESASLSTMKNKRKKTVGALCRKQASVQNMRSLHFALDKTVASCIQRSIDARHGAFYLRRDLLPRVVVCGSRARGTIRLCKCFNFQLVPPALLWHTELQTLCTHFVYSIPGCSIYIPSRAGTYKSSYKWCSISPKSQNYPSHWERVFVNQKKT